jgi:DNA-binding GntR family transcriptional regulator
MHNHKKDLQRARRSGNPVRFPARRKSGLQRDDIGPSLVERAYEAVLERILSGRYSEGMVLSELALAAELKVSRTPVHDALRLLAIDGFVTQERNRRARVVNFSADDLFEVFEMRKLLEGHAAELAAGRMDSRQLAPLRAMADLLHEGLNARDWCQRWAEFDEAFHRAIAEASGNSRLRTDILRYRLLHRGINRLSTDPKSLRRALAEHEEILDALEARDGATARSQMLAHINEWQKFFSGQFSEARLRSKAVESKRS